MDRATLEPAARRRDDHRRLASCCPSSAAARRATLQATQAPAPRGRRRFSKATMLRNMKRTVGAQRAHHEHDPDRCSRASSRRRRLQQCAHRAGRARPGNWPACACSASRAPEVSALLLGELAIGIAHRVAARHAVADTAWCTLIARTVSSPISSSFLVVIRRAPMHWPAWPYCWPRASARWSCAAHRPAGHGCGFEDPGVTRMKRTTNLLAPVAAFVAAAALLCACAVRAAPRRGRGGARGPRGPYEHHRGGRPYPLA